jgi:hypothetical protein
MHTGPAAIVAAIKVVRQPSVVSPSSCHQRNLPWRHICIAQVPGQMQHDIANLTIDVQPSITPTALVIMVTGKLKVSSSLHRIFSCNSSFAFIVFL